MPRLFVAVWPPEDVLDLVAGLDRPVVEGLRWTERAQWHITLRFLGSVDSVDPVVEALARLPVVEGTAVVLGPTTERFDRRILHVPVHGVEDVASAVVAVTAQVGKPPDDRPFHGHLTLARVAKHRKVDLRPLVGTQMEARWTMEAVCLVESRLTSSGARYEVLERFPRPPSSREGRSAQFAGGERATPSAPPGLGRGRIGP